LFGAARRHRGWIGVQQDALASGAFKFPVATAGRGQGETGRIVSGFESCHGTEA